MFDFKEQNNWETISPNTSQLAIHDTYHIHVELLSFIGMNEEVTFENNRAKKTLMKNKTNYIKQVLPVIGLFFLCSAAIHVKNTYTLSKDYIITIHGDSNLHDWEEKVEQVSGSAVVDKKNDGSFDLLDMNIKLIVHSIKSDMGSIMDKNTYEALKANVNPNILFTLSAPVKAIQKSATKTTISVKGNLTIAGVTNAILMPVNVSMPDNQTLHFEGAPLIKMSDYNVTPPNAMFGTLKTGNQITLHFKTNFIIDTEQ